ncbi:MAG: HNH endonuclease signature motif containing protein [Patescibacteria group bacterium]
MQERKIFALVVRGVFEVDSAGRVWRRKKRMSNGGLFTIRRVRAEKEMPNGYLVVRAKMGEGKYVKCLAHRLVWECWHGPIPNGQTVNHKNGDKADNRPENLELATQKEQAKHARDVLGTKADWRGTKNPSAKLDQKSVADIRYLLSVGARCVDIAADFGVSDRTISAIKRGRIWRDNP